MVQKAKNILTRLKTTTLKKCRVLDRHTERNKDITYANNKIYYLLCQPKTFVNAYAKISKNKGSLTKGVKEDEEVMKLFGLKQAVKISDKFKKGEYKWKPTRRTWIPKPGKAVKLPIDTPTQEDRIAQEAIRGILEAIYEPEFRAFEEQNQRTCTNFGFRPHLSCWDAVENMRINGKRATYGIKADIKQAYNNVNHKMLMKILTVRIKDQRFLQIIYNLLKSGIMEKNIFGDRHSVIGTPQGGIVSPLLFNIYMFEFDKKIFQEIVGPMNKSIVQPKADPEYSRLGRTLSRLSAQKPVCKTQRELHFRKKLIKAIRRERLSRPSQTIETLPKQALFCRYADDWILLITGSKKDAEDLILTISDLLKKQLRLELDPNKTEVARFNQGLKFLGFSVKMWKPKQMRLKRVLVKAGATYRRHLTRTTSRKITINPDRDRLIDNLTLKGFRRKIDGMPMAKAAWVSLDEYEIVKKFGQMVIGLHNFYAACDSQAIMHYVQYILKYSCTRTLARRRKESSMKVLARYGKDLSITKQLQVTKTGDKEKRTLTVQFPTMKKKKKKKKNG